MGLIHQLAIGHSMPGLQGTQLGTCKLGSPEGIADVLQHLAS